MCDTTEEKMKGFNWPVHHELLSHGVLISENLRGLEVLAGRRVEFLFLLLNIRGADGARARAAGGGVLKD